MSYINLRQTIKLFLIFSTILADMWLEANGVEASHPLLEEAHLYFLGLLVHPKDGYLEFNTLQAHICGNCQLLLISLVARLSLLFMKWRYST